MAIALPSTLMAGAYPGDHGTVRGGRAGAGHATARIRPVSMRKRVHCSPARVSAIPGIGRSMFGGGMEAGATLCAPGADLRVGRFVPRPMDRRGLAYGPGRKRGQVRRLADTGFTLQSVARYVNGMGVRFGLGVDHIFKRERGRPRTVILPTYSFTVLAQSAEWPLPVYGSGRLALSVRSYLGLGFDL